MVFPVKEGYGGNNEKKMIKIQMTGGPGDPWRDDAWCDTLIMTPNSISYTFRYTNTPDKDKERHWSYQSDSWQFKRQFEHIAWMLGNIAGEPQDVQKLDLDGRFIRCLITYDDQSNEDERFFVSSEIHRDLFHGIPKLVPGIELTPVLTELYEE